MKKYAIIVAAGSGNRMNTETPKQFLLLNKLPVLMHTISAFCKYDKNIELILVLSENKLKYWEQLCKKHHFTVKHTIVKGGETRFHSVKNALSRVPGTSSTDELIAIHDGVRPLVSKATIERCYDTALKLGNAVPAVDVIESIRIIEHNTNKAVDRSKYKLIQTPQVFQGKLIKQAYEQKFIPQFTDDASVIEAAGHKINLVEGNRENIKITTDLDLLFARILIKNVP